MFSDGISGIFPVEPEQRGGVFLKLLDAKIFNAVTVNPDFGCVEWPGRIDLCPDTMHQTMIGAESEAELHSPMALREAGKSKSSLWPARRAGCEIRPQDYRLNLTAPPADV